MKGFIQSSLEITLCMLVLMYYVYINFAAESVWSKTPLYIIVITILSAMIAVLIVVVVYQNVCCPRFHSLTTEDKVITNIENKSFSGDTYEEVKIPPPTSNDQNYENTNNGSSSQYEELQHDLKHEDEHNYQSLQKKT